MKKYGIKKFLLAVLTGIFLFQVCVYADVDKLNVSQIIQKGNDVYLYVSALDNTGRLSGDGLNAEQLSVKIDEGKAVAAQDAVPYQSLGQGSSYIFCIDVSKSLTKEEMQAIKDSMTAFVNSMGPADFVRIITIGSEITSVCDSTQDRNALLGAIQGIDRNADYTYLYKGLSFAMDGQRKRMENVPERAAIILFTDGMDDSDGAYTAEQVMDDSSVTRIPIYAVGLKGQDANASLNSVGQIAQQSGGSVYSYSDMGISEAVQTIQSIMQNSYQVHIQPSTKTFGKKNLNWSVTYAPGNYSVESKPYVYSLNMDNVVVPTKKPKATPEPTAVPTPEPTPTPVPEKSTIEKVTDFLQENLIICIAVVMIIIAVIIILVILLKRRRDFETHPLPQDNGPEPVNMDSGTLPENDGYENDSDRTMDPYDSETTMYDDDTTMYDSEETMDMNDSAGITIEFEITFEGYTDRTVAKLKDELVLGRGEECDVDVVLNSTSENRKHTSRKHAIMMDCPDGIYIKNNSKNKTYLNGVEVVGEMALRNGDVLRMGDSSVKINILA